QYITCPPIMLRVTIVPSGASHSVIQSRYAFWADIPGLSYTPSASFGAGSTLPFFDELARRLSGNLAALPPWPDGAVRARVRDHVRNPHPRCRRRARNLGPAARGSVRHSAQHAAHSGRDVARRLVGRGRRPRAPVP